MTCIDSQELMAWIEEEVSVAKSTEIKTHLESCSTCSKRLAEIQMVINAVGPNEGKLGSSAFVEKVLAQTEAKATPQKNFFYSKWLRTATLGAATVAILVVILISILEPNDGFRPRGSGTNNPDAWISFDVFRPQPESEIYQPVSETIFNTDSLVFSVLNRPQSGFTYLMIFGIQQNHQVVWYHPAWTAEMSATPDSIAIPSGIKPTHLREEIRHDLEIGPLRLFAVFSNTPWDAKTIEGVIRTQLRKSRDIERLIRLPLEDTGQQTLLLQVVQEENP
jgi:hypothetical protein